MKTKAISTTNATTSLTIPPRSNILLLMGDLNAQNSSSRQGLEHVIVPFGSATTTYDNRECLLMLCFINGLCVVNTYFPYKRVHRKTETEIDYICISKVWRSSLSDVKACRGADVGSDHHLVRGKIKLKLKYMRNRRRLGVKNSKGPPSL